MRDYFIREVYFDTNLISKFSLDIFTSLIATMT